MNAAYFATDKYFIWKMHIQNEKEKSQIEMLLCEVACLYAEGSYLNHLDKNEQLKLKSSPNRRILSLTHTNLRE